MAHYQPAPYSDSPATGGYRDDNYGNSYGNNAGNNYGGYSDEPGYASGGYGRNAQGGGGDSCE